ncbi:MAG: ATP-binding cassette domain-containing protein [Mycoplasmatales bacterium]
MNSLKILINDYNLSLKDNILLENASLDIEFNKLILLGKNGTGKSTILNMIHQKKIKVSGSNKVSTSLASQDHNLIKNYTVFDNVKTFGVNKENFYNDLKYFNKNILLSSKVNQLSGGQKQLVNLLLSLNLDRELYLLDEPLNNIDKNIKEKLRGYLENTSKNIILVSHEEIYLPNYKKIMLKKRDFIYV